MSMTVYEAFTESREFVPVLFKGINAKEQTATLSELNKQAGGQNILARIFNDVPSPLDE